MNRLSTETRTRILAALCEGASINATSRQTGVSKVTILKLLAEVGEAVLDYQRKTLVNLPCKRVASGRSLELRPVQGEERPEGGEGNGTRRCLDVDGDLRRHEGHTMLAHRQTRCRCRSTIYEGSSIASRDPRSTHDRWPQGLSDGCRRSLWVERCGLRDAREIVWPPRLPARRATVHRS